MTNIACIVWLAGLRLIFVAVNCGIEVCPLTLLSILGLLSPEITAVSRDRSSERIPYARGKSKKHEHKTNNLAVTRLCSGEVTRYHDRVVS